MSGSILEAGWLPDATCELNPVFPGATLEGGGSAHIAQNHQINIPHRVAHRVSHYCSRLVVGRGSYPGPPSSLYHACVPPSPRFSRKVEVICQNLCS